eukprot:scaffold16450_cov181-Isochrysis_galbana.AAC.2
MTVSFGAGAEGAARASAGGIAYSLLRDRGSGVSASAADTVRCLHPQHLVRRLTQRRPAIREIELSRETT